MLIFNTIKIKLSAKITLLGIYYLKNCGSTKFKLLLIESAIKILMRQGVEGTMANEFTAP